MPLARTTQLTARALLLGIPAGLFHAWVQGAVFDQQRDVLPVLLASSLLRCTLLAAAALMVWVVVFQVTSKRMQSATSARLATFLAFLPPFLLLARAVNQRLLPGPAHPRSLLCNFAILAVGCVLFLLLSAGLRRWQEGAWKQRRSVGSLLGALLLVPLGVLLAAPGPQRDPAPDILVILLDVLRADHLGCYGYERATSPNIDALAEDGILFENLISASTYTKTSVASLFTGLAAFHHGVYTGTDGGGTGSVESDLLSDRFTTLAEALFDHGLNTSAWVQNAHVRPYLGYAQGFTFYADQPGSAQVIAEAFGAWKDDWASVARYFTYLHIVDIHGPYDPEPPFLGKFGPVPEPGQEVLPPGDPDAWVDFKQAAKKGEHVPSAAELAELEARYDEMIAYVDHWVGRIIDDLKATGRYDNTLIMVLSDHGEGFWEHGFISHSTAPFEELNHVPMIVKMPHSSGAGRRVDRMLGHVDIGPTLLEFAGAPAPEGLDGQSFLSLLQDPDAELEPRTRFIEYLGMVGVRTERWKYITMRGREPQLFDLRADPLELTNCIADHPDVAAQLDALNQYARDERAKGKAERVVLDSETVDALHALGYL